ncbi:MAG: trypsin-like peptidase domain-containing protein [Armatimonadetes bacterium]|nr:trypsin-like peptidase domain-containing protein [Armatimonadota bacterium]
MRRVVFAAAVLAVWCTIGRAADGARTMEDAVATVRPITLMVEADLRYGQRSYGSGFLVSSDGLVATCAHVVRRSQEVACYYRNGERIRAKKALEDEDLDLAVLKLEGDRTYPTALLGDSDLDAVEGTAVGVCGYPLPTLFFRVGVGLDSTSISGSVSALRLGDRPENRSRNAVLQLDAVGQPGNSGGPVFRIADSKIIGVLALRLEGNTPIAFAIPVNQLTAETLVTIRDDKEMASTFVNPMNYRGSAADDTGVFDEFIPAFGFDPAAHPRPAVDGPDLYVGGLNHFMHRIRHRRLVTEEEWNVELDYPVTMPAAVDKDNVVVGAGTLNLSWQAGQLNVGERMGAATVNALTMGLGGLFKWKKRIARVIDTDGRVYVIDKDDGRLNSQVDTAFPGAPVLSDGVAYIPALGQLMAYDTTNGTVKWTVGDFAKAMEGRTWYNAALGSDGKLYTFEVPVRLNVREIRTDASGAMPSLPRLFYLEFGLGKSHDDPSGRGNCLLRCRDPKDGKVQWETPLFNATTYLRPLATALILSDDAKMAYCQLGPLALAVNLETKKVAWPDGAAMKVTVASMVKACWDRQRELEKRAGGDVVASFHDAGLSSGTSSGMTLANGRLYYGCYDIPSEGSDKAYLRVVAADTGEEAKRLACPGRPSAPLVYDGMVYFGASHIPPVWSGRGEPRSWLYAYGENTLQEAWRLRVDHYGLSYAPQAVGRSLYFADMVYLYELPLPLR